MKSSIQPCAVHRESLALLACSVSGDVESAPLRAHLKACPACREYFAELRAICAAQSSAAQALSTVEVPPQLHRRVAAAIRASRPVKKANWLEALRMNPLPFVGAAALALVCLGGWALLRPASSSGNSQAQLDVVRRPDPIPAVPAVAAASGGDPRFLGYRLALNRSPEAFEQLLTVEEARPSYNAGAPMLRNLARSEADF